MSTSSARRSVSIERTGSGRFTVTNARGGRLTISTGDDAEFTPTELLLAAIGGCTAVDVDTLTTRRAEPESSTVVVAADKVRDEHGNRLTGIEVVFRLRFPDGAAGDAARAVLPGAVTMSHDRLCSVGRTIEVGTPIATRIE